MTIVNKVFSCCVPRTHCFPEDTLNCLFDYITELLVLMYTFVIKDRQL